jgi:hypothetical protein
MHQQVDMRRQALNDAVRRRQFAASLHERRLVDWSGAEARFWANWIA